MSCRYECNGASLAYQAEGFIGCWVWKILVRLLRIDAGRISKVNDSSAFLHIISSLPESFHSFCKTLTQLLTIKGTRLRSMWHAKQGPGSTLMEMEMSAVRAVIAAISSAPTYCLSEHCRRGGGMDRVLSLIGSKSKPPPLSLSFPASAGQSEARSVGSNLKVRYLKVTAATADIQEGISSFCSGFSFFIRL